MMSIKTFNYIINWIKNRYSILQSIYTFLRWNTNVQYHFLKTYVNEIYDLRSIINYHGIEYFAILNEKITNLFGHSYKSVINELTYYIMFVVRCTSLKVVVQFIIVKIVTNFSWDAIIISRDLQSSHRGQPWVRNR